MRAKPGAIEKRLAPLMRERREERLAGARGVQRDAVPDDGEQAHDLRARGGLDVHGHRVVEDAQVRGLAGGFDEGLEQRTRREPELVVPAAAVGQRRDLGARVVATRVGVLADVAAPEERREEAVDRADVELRPGREGRDRDFAVGAGKRFEEVERAVDGLDRPAGPARLGGFFHRSEFLI